MLRHLGRLNNAEKSKYAMDYNGQQFRNQFQFLTFSFQS